MFKKLLFMLSVWLAFAVAYAGDPTYVSMANDVGDVTVDSTYGSGWECIDSFIIAIDDSSYTVLTVSGVAVLDPGDVLYIGFGKDSANCVDSATCAAAGYCNSHLDTLKIKAPKEGRGKSYIPFTVKHADLYESVTDITDTFYINASVGGSTQWEQVTLEDVFTTVELLNND